MSSRRRPGSTAMISPLSSYGLPLYSPDQVMALPGCQSVSTVEPNMYSLIWAGSVSAAQTASPEAAMSISAVATMSVME